MLEFLSLQYRIGRLSQEQLLQTLRRGIISADDFEKIVKRG